MNKNVPAVIFALALGIASTSAYSGDMDSLNLEIKNVQQFSDTELSEMHGANAQLPPLPDDLPQSLGFLFFLLFLEEQRGSFAGVLGNGGLDANLGVINLLGGRFEAELGEAFALTNILGNPAAGVAGVFEQPLQLLGDALGNGVGSGGIGLSDTGLIFRDGFESGDFSAFSTLAP